MIPTSTCEATVALHDISYMNFLGLLCYIKKEDKKYYGYIIIGVKKNKLVLLSKYEMKIINFENFIKNKDILFINDNKAKYSSLPKPKYNNNNNNNNNGNNLYESDSDDSSSNDSGNGDIENNLYG